MSRHSRSAQSERGYYSQALREGRVRRPPPEAPRIVNTLLWVFNVLGWLLLVTFMAWQVYILYFAESM